jgi:hypothetical protein
MTAPPSIDMSGWLHEQLATNILTLNERLKTLDAQIDELFAQAAIIQSMPGFGPFLGATLLVAAGDLRAFPKPVTWQRPLRYSRPLRHVGYLSAQTSVMRDGPNRDYYLNKRASKRTHPSRDRPRPRPRRRRLGTAAGQSDLDL